jgi:oligoendopeptidase F
MLTRSNAVRRKKPPARAAKAAKPAAVGKLPEWDLSALYPSLDSPQIKEDLARADTMCLKFEEQYKGKLLGLAHQPNAGQALAAAIETYETIDDRIGRVVSYAQLVYSGNTTDPVRAKFYGDVQDRVTTSSSHLLFFSLELNRIDDALLERAMADPALGHYCARPSLISSRIASSSCSTRNR